ncbi:hypothetical protein Pla8534_07990 [Lignipirellula cremea]|uniref:Uncharacterized protein n=2 Tax=Lignipirellula cremea TaxID=2528010 RepID=A0A518DMF6_9BACT|nr:hypothetical protein Pla8534_07990 [Lignipirellula cremea]
MFLQLANDWKKNNATAREVITSFWQFQKEVIVDGTQSEFAGHDELSLHLGKACEMGFDNIADYRHQNYESKWSEEKYLALIVTRTINPVEGDYDDDAYAMTVSLYYNKGEDFESQALYEVTEDDLAQYLALESVQKILDVAPRKYEGYVAGAG